jgi:hypothetical protein
MIEIRETPHVGQSILSFVIPPFGGSLGLLLDFAIPPRKAQLRAVGPAIATSSIRKVRCAGSAASS